MAWLQLKLLLAHNPAYYCCCSRSCIVYAFRILPALHRACNYVSTSCLSGLMYLYTFIPEAQVVLQISTATILQGSPLYDHPQSIVLLLLCVIFGVWLCRCQTGVAAQRAGPERPTCRTGRLAETAALEGEGEEGTGAAAAEVVAGGVVPKGLGVEGVRVVAGAARGKRQVSSAVAGVGVGVEEGLQVVVVGGVVPLRVGAKAGEGGGAGVEADDCRQITEACWQGHSFGAQP